MTTGNWAMNCGENTLITSKRVIHLLIRQAHLNQLAVWLLKKAGPAKEPAKKQIKQATLSFKPQLPVP